MLSRSICLMPRSRRLTTIVKTPTFFRTLGAARHAIRRFPTNYTCQIVSILSSQRKLVTERSMQFSTPLNMRARNSRRPCYRFLYNLPTSSPINPRPISQLSAPVTPTLPRTVSRTKLGSPLQSPFLLLFSSSFHCSLSTSMSTRTLLKNIPTTATTTQATNTTTAKSTFPNPPPPGVKARHGKAPTLGIVPRTLAHIKYPILPP